MKDIKQMEKELKAKREEKSKIDGQLKDIKGKYQRLKAPLEKLAIQIQALKAVIKQTGGDDSDLKLIQKRFETIQKKIDVLNDERTKYIKQVKKLEHQIPQLATEIKVVKYLTLKLKIWELRGKTIKDWKALNRNEVEEISKLQGEMNRLKRNLPIAPNIISGIDRGTYPSKSEV